MTVERSRPGSDEESIREDIFGGELEIDPYWVARSVYNARVEGLKLIGWLRRPSEITNEWELDDHFDDLRRLYRQTCLELGLVWPPSMQEAGKYDLNGQSAEGRS